MLQPEVVAIDIDLRKMTAVSSTRGVLCHLADPAETRFPVGPGAVTLIEIAGPVMHRGGDQRTMHHTHRWMLYNAATVGLIVSTALAAGHPAPLVATSTAWTLGYPEAQRHQIAGMCPIKYSKTGVALYGEPHDVRECRAMLYFYSKNPRTWKPLDEWLKEL